VIVEFAVRPKRGFDLAFEKTLRLCVGQPPVTLGGVNVRLFAGDTEEMSDHFGGLTHVEFSDRVGEPTLQPNHRFEITGARLCQRGYLGESALGAGQACEPAHALLWPNQRRVAQRFGSACQDQVRGALTDIAVPSVDRLHAGAAIDLHREGDHCFAHPESQGGDPRRIHLVGDHVDAAEDDLIEVRWGEWLPG